MHLSDETIAILFLSFTSVTARDLADYLRAELVATTPEEFEIQEWNTESKMKFFLSVWQPTGLPN